MTLGSVIREAILIPDPQVGHRSGSVSKPPALRYRLQLRQEPFQGLGRLAAARQGRGAER